MTFPNGSTQPDAQNDTDVSLWQKMVQSAADWAVGAGKAGVEPDAQDSVYDSRYKLVQNLYNYLN